MNMATPATTLKKKRRTGSAPPGFERVSTLAKRIGFAESTVKGWVASKLLGFPEPIRLGSRVSIYNTESVNAWMAERGILPAQATVPA
jgi:predicted DNA-binding transcriptional regulator AlpA